MSAAHDPARWERLKHVVADAMDQPAPARAAYVASACGPDAALRAEAEGLLAYEDPAFIERSLATDLARILGEDAES